MSERRDEWRAAALIPPATVAVIGSGSDGHEPLAHAVGRLLAGRDVNLLTGGGGGVMREVARAYVAVPDRRGISIGVIPCADESRRAQPMPGYPNAFVELPIHTHLPYSGRLGTHDLSRNHINVLTAAAIIALPGGAGTESEVQLALRYQRPVTVFSPDPRMVQHFPAEAPRVATIAEVAAFLDRCLADVGARQFPRESE